MSAATSAAPWDGAPARLERTGFGSPRVRAFSPQYPLWTDGARKERFIQLPAGGVIDGSDPDDWRFPVGTKLWKAFRFGEEVVEIRYLERTRRGWRYGVYVPDGRGGMVLAPESGVPRAFVSADGVTHDVPAKADCVGCHEGRNSPVLGFSALQLSADRDPLAPHAEAKTAVDLRTLVQERLLSPLSEWRNRTRPRIDAATDVERAALGYLHGNCGSCHNDRGPLSVVGMNLWRGVNESRAEALSTLLSVPSRFGVPGVAATQRVSPGHPERSAVLFRIASRNPIAQMPPTGSHRVDEQAVARVREWINEVKPQ